jgi:hypothetical protein
MSDAAFRVTDTWGCGGPYSNATAFLCSMECEIESVAPGSGKGMSAWKAIPDHSLRNNGVEYISTVAKPRKDAVQDFEQLHKMLKLGDNPFSYRTSTHVHVNVSSMRQDHARNMVLLYALFEEFFFAMVRPERRDNIHCVPLTETHLSMYYSKPLSSLFEVWSKYTALNLKRLTDLGTMEFRHMHGTGDKAEIEVWLHVLENLWKVAQRVEINEKTLSDRKEITDWFEMIFFPADRVMACKPTLFDIIRNSLIDVKFSTVKTKE